MLLPEHAKLRCRCHDAARVPGCLRLRAVHAVSRVAPRRFLHEEQGVLISQIHGGVEQRHPEFGIDVVALGRQPVLLEVDIRRFIVRDILHVPRRHAFLRPVGVINSLGDPLVCPSAKIVGIINEPAFPVENKLQSFLELGIVSVLNGRLVHDLHHLKK